MKTLMCRCVVESCNVVTTSVNSTVTQTIVVAVSNASRCAAAAAKRRLRCGRVMVVNEW